MAEAQRFKFTKAVLDALPLPAAGTRATYHDTWQRALTVRVTETGKKTFRVRGRPRGQTKVETNTIGTFPEFTIEQARAEAANQLAKWARSESIVARRVETKKQARNAITFEQALRRYVVDKRRSKDGLPLKTRTRDDYLQMVDPGREGVDGKRGLQPGELAALSSIPLNRITADDLRRTYSSVSDERGQRRGSYAMAVARAVLNWHGTKVPQSPFDNDRSIPGCDRIRLVQAPEKPNPIPLERVGAWWRAASTPPAGTSDLDTIGDYLRFLLLTGCRSIEVKGGKRGALVYGEGLHVADVDLVARRLRLADTKNRRDHVILLPKQALEIVQRHVKGKTPAAALFAVGDVRDRLAAINAEAGVSVSPHDLRATFINIAAARVPVYTMKRMVNHLPRGDVTDASYIQPSDAQLRAGWQAVADFIEQQTEESADSPQSEEQPFKAA